jgi:hypothetical protein
VSDPEARHSRNIAARPQVAIVTVGTADEERVPSVSPVRYAPAEYRVLISTEASACRCEGLAIVE